MLIGTDRFRPVLEATRAMTGVPELRWAEVPHPVGSLTQEELRQRAELAVDQLATIVVSREAPTGDRGTARPLAR